MSISPVLKSVVESLEYDPCLPLEWKVGDLTRFSPHKSLYEYQQMALRNAAKAIYLYYGPEGREWRRDETPEETLQRKRAFLDQYQGKISVRDFVVPEYTGPRGRRVRNPIFSICAPYLQASNGAIGYDNFINRMGFWMATGSGKTLVIVKIMEHLVWLMKEHKIPSHDILVLAPTEHALEQIFRAVDEFNSRGDKHFDLRHLREFRNEENTLSFNNTVRVYYCRADHLSAERKTQLINWKEYENRGRWFVFLDEAHKGGQGESKRKAYYALLARAGFLFNFSATFSDAEDVCTAVTRYNLSDFVGDGRGKRILRAASVFSDQRDACASNFSSQGKTRIILESLLALASARQCVRTLREKTARADLYHMPLMLTLVNSVNTEDLKNDLFSFFQVLRQIAGNDLDRTVFSEVKELLREDWRRGHRLFEVDGDELPQDNVALGGMNIDKLREQIFGSKERGALEYMADSSGKQIAFKLKTASTPFALIKIGSIEKWTKEFLRGMESTQAHAPTDWFSDLESRPEFSILMGSRSFFESWDSTRPNVINFINIGKNKDARIFITQSVGRGVRIAPMKGRRRRLAQLWPSLPEKEKPALENVTATDVAPLETLLLYATNQEAVDTVLGGMRDEDERLPFIPLDDSLFVQDTSPSLPLLVPEYRDASHGKLPSFRIAASDHRRLSGYAQNVSDALLSVAGGMSPQQISDLREITDRRNVEVSRQEGYSIDALQRMIVARTGRAQKKTQGVRVLSEDDIVHFRRMEVSLSKDQAGALEEKIRNIVASGGGQKEMRELFRLAATGEISEEEFMREQRKQGAQVSKYSNSGVELSIRYCVQHYYAPLITADKKADFIRFAIDDESETKFLVTLEEWLSSNKPEWDPWAFCKLNEHRDKVHIPYYNQNRLAKFSPDFIFWMKRDKEYQIVFVDPKGMAHSAYLQKVDGYRQLFEDGRKPRVFKKDGVQVKVRLLMYNQNVDITPKEYRRFWTDNIQNIFETS